METAECWYNKTPPTYPERAFHSPELRIVLLGVSGVGKSATGNVILGRKAFKETRTRVSEIQRGRVEDRNISVIDTPGFFTTELTDEEQQNEMMKSVSLCHPGPHVFLLIVNIENMKEEERNLVKQIGKNFGPQAFKFTLVLFIGREKMSNKEWMVFMLSEKFQELVRHCRDKYHAINSVCKIKPTHTAKLLQKIKEIVKQNDDQHYKSEIYLKSSTKIRKEKQKLAEEKKDREQHRERDKTRVSKTVQWETFKCEMEEKIAHVVKELEKESFISHMRKTHEKTHVDEELFFKKTRIVQARDSSSLVRSLRFSFERMTGSDEIVQKGTGSWKMSETGKQEQKNTQADLRIVMVGKTGAGKSATGNTILREKVFEEKMSPISVTGKCKQYKQRVEGRIISVIDTPGLYDTSNSEQKTKDEIARCVEMSLPGPHAFLLVIRLDVRFTEEEKNTVKWIQENFGENAAHYTIILFTRGDQLKTSIDEFLVESKEINELIKQCKAGYQVFSNTNKDQAQVSELLSKIDTMVTDNGGEHYTIQMYQEAQRKIQEEEERQREEDKRLRCEEEVKIRKDEQIRLVKTGALVGAGVGGVIGGVALAASTGVALPALLITGSAALAGGACAKAITDTAKLKKQCKKSNSK